MSDLMKSKEALKSKKAIAKAMATFESRMLKSKNDLERLSVLDDLDQVLDSEISQWIEKLNEVENKSDTESENIFNEGSKQILDLQESKLKINEFRISFLPGARKTYEVMNREGLKPKHTISLDTVNPVRKDELN